MTFTPDMLATIRRNAGKVHKHVLANDLGVSVNFLERKAREHGYDLRVIAERIIDPAAPIGSAHSPLPAAERGDKTGPRRRERALVRTEHVSATFLPGDVAILDRIAAQHHIKRARVISRAIENAIRREMLAELVRLPSPAPDTPSPGDRTCAATDAPPS